MDLSHLPAGLRAVVASRVSHVQGKQKTSHITQHEAGGKVVTAQQWELVGTVEDLNVSATKKGPWERKDLKQWLTDKVGELDILIFTKTDRVFRRGLDNLELTQWAKKHKKAFLIIDDNILIDYITPEDKKDPQAVMYSQMWLMFCTMFATMEGQRHVQRANDRLQFLDKTDRWSFGRPTYGFEIIEHKTGVGKSLGLEAETQAVLHRAAEEFLNDKRITRICVELTEGKVLSPGDWIRSRNGEELRGSPWTPDVLKHILTSPATQGWKVLKGRVAINNAGEPIRVGPPSFDQDTWDQIQQRMKEQETGPRTQLHSGNPLLGVCKCGNCGANLRQQTNTKPSGKKYRYYRCSESPKPCPGISIIANDAEEIVENAFLETHRDRRVKVRKWRTGSDHSAELAQTVQTIEDLREDRAQGLFSSPEDQALYRSQMKSLTAKRDQLAALPIVRAGWENVETDQTYGEVWQTSSMEEKRKMLVDANVRLVVFAPNHWTIHTDTDAVLGEGEAPEEVFERLTRTETL